jgi:hypothetical protein
MRKGIVCSLLLFLSCAPVLWAQEFQNLDFEEATVPSTPVGSFGSFVDPAAAFPFWTIGPGGSFAPNAVLYNNLTLGSVAEVLVGPDFPNVLHLSPLQGSYSALLQFGPNVYNLGIPALIQTGLVPANARSISFLMSSTMNDVQVSLDGTVIPLVSIGGGRIAGDVTAFAGQTAQLMFTTTSYDGNWLYFDDVQFSPEVIPEPSTFALTAAALMVLFGVQPRRS